MIELSSDSEDGSHSEADVGNESEVDDVSTYSFDGDGMEWEETSSSEETSSGQRFYVEYFFPDYPSECCDAEAVIEKGEDQRHGDDSSDGDGEAVSDSST